jgi:23S rRNA pseudouridine1911/1915/1917 synthase
LVTQFSSRSNEKIYLCVTQNIPIPAAETIFTHIGRDSRNRQKMAVVTPPSGRASITDYKVICADASTRTALVLCHLHTGRTHQIRVHMESIGHPVLGDPVYASKAARLSPALATASAALGRQALHAVELAFAHPVSGEALRFQSALPTDIRAALDALQVAE